MDVINELVDETEKFAEDKNTYNLLKSEGINPFKTKNVSEVFNAEEVSSIILKELTDIVDGCDASFANLVFLQTEEGLKDLQNKIRAKESLEVGNGGFFRSEESFGNFELHEITPDESKAVCAFINEYKNNLDKSLENNSYIRLLSFKKDKAERALNGNSPGSFRRQ